ncbi:MAG: hypothetical protein COV43_05930 [Deltaproteobacteria bacterium CG11_big_fil_rev_8_21_14_0_20_42_23]|nr:MAG: hypothetical protein COV43_05930 [Deltaproteobacteria bacterium CG11_big_fil_rev_8_21_14_0_20_42_23]PJC65188.1 MAG: hypothetical protein CO021_00380 [Deltaproteobacteria bacterium CG_4_9_14_0_2_um_filter_42_21]
MYRKLNLDRDKVDRCRKAASRVLAPVFRYIQHHSSVSIERATLEALGFSGEKDGVSAADLFVAALSRDQLRFGAANWMLSASLRMKVSVPELAKLFLAGKLDVKKISRYPVQELKPHGERLLRETLETLRLQRRYREQLRLAFPIGKFPHLQYELSELASEGCELECKEAASLGAHIFSIPIQKGQPSLASLQMQSKVTASSSWLKAFRKFLDEEGERRQKYFRLCVDPSSLCVPEFSLLSAQLGVDVQVLDPFYAAEQGGLCLKRTLIDASFSAKLLTLAGIHLSSKGDRLFLSQASSSRLTSQVFVFHVLHELFFQEAGVEADAISVSHRLHLDVDEEDSSLQEIAHAQVLREFFPRSPVLYFPPHKNESKLGDWTLALYHLIALLSEQSVHVLGGKNDLLAERLLSLKQANVLLKSAKSIGDELSLNTNGKIARRSHMLLENTLKLLEKLEREGFFEGLQSEKIFSNAISQQSAVGNDGIFQKERTYYNPLMETLSQDQASLEK